MNWAWAANQKQAPPQAFRDLIGKKKEWIGWLASIAAFLIVLYYAVIIGWAVDYAFLSINLDFAGNPEGFVFNDFLQITDGPFSFGAINWIIVFGLGIVWVWIYSELSSPYGGYDTLALSIGFFIVVIGAPIASFILAMTMQARLAAEEEEWDPILIFPIFSLI